MLITPVIATSSTRFQTRRVRPAFSDMLEHFSKQASVGLQPQEKR